MNCIQMLRSVFYSLIFVILGSVPAVWAMDRPMLLGSPPTEPQEGLVWGVLRGDVHTVSNALARGADPNVLVKNRFGTGNNTLIQELLLREDRSWDPTSILVALFNSGRIRLDLRDVDGNTALHTAARMGECALLEDLVRYARSQSNWREPINAQNNTGQTPLYVAAAHGHFDCVQNLLDHYADVNIADVYGNTPFAAALFQYPDIAAFLADRVDLKQPASGERIWVQPDPRERSIIFYLNRRTPLALAAWDRLDHAIVTLVQRGARADVADANGDTPLHLYFKPLEFGLYGVQKPAEREIIALLLRAGADPFAANREGLRPVDLAMSRGELQVLEAALRQEGGMDDWDVVDVEEGAAPAPSRAWRPVQKAKAFAGLPWQLATQTFERGKSSVARGKSWLWGGARQAPVPAGTVDPEFYERRDRCFEWSLERRKRYESLVGAEDPDPVLAYNAEVDEQAMRMRKRQWEARFILGVRPGADKPAIDRAYANVSADFLPESCAARGESAAYCECVLNLINEARRTLAE